MTKKYSTKLIRSLSEGAAEAFAVASRDNKKIPKRTLH